MKKSVVGCCLGLFLGSMLVACGAVPGDEEAASVHEPTSNEGAEADVGDVSQALGAWRELFLATRGIWQLHVGPRYTLFAENAFGGELCAVPVVVLTATGEKLNVPRFPGCGRVNAAVSDGSGLFVHHSSNDTLYALSEANGAFSWSPIAFTDESANKMAIDSQYVYWSEGWTVYRVGRGGSPVSTLATARTLVGVAGDDLYLIGQIGTGHDLKRRTLSGQSESTVRTGIDPGDVFDSTFDATHLYFASNSLTSGGTNRIQRIARSGGALSTMKSSAEVRYVAPFSNRSALYWREERISDGAATIRRRNHANGNHVTQPFPMAEMEHMLVASSGIYAIGRAETGPALIRGDL